jgi:hypothetical protein
LFLGSENSSPQQSSFYFFWRGEWWGAFFWWEGLKSYRMGLYKIKLFFTAEFSDFSDKNFEEKTIFI